MVNKKDLSRKLSKRTALNSKEAEQVIDEFLSLLLEEVVESKEVSIVGFGKFYSYEHKPRPVRNPKTQEQMILEPYESLKFKPSNIVKNLFKAKLKKTSS